MGSRGSIGLIAIERGAFHVDRALHEPADRPVDALAIAYFRDESAVEGSAYVPAPCAIVSQEMFDILCDTPQKAFLLNPRTSKPGGGFTQIYSPDGRALCEPLADDEEGIVYADLDPAMIAVAKAAADPAGRIRDPTRCNSWSIANCVR